jgi:hypothetical protein
MDGSVVHESDGDDVQLSGDKYDADRCRGHVCGWWWDGDAFLSCGAGDGDGGNYV